MGIISPASAQQGCRQVDHGKSIRFRFRGTLVSHCSHLPPNGTLVCGSRASTDCKGSEHPSKRGQYLLSAESQLLCKSWGENAWLGAQRGKASLPQILTSSTASLVPSLLSPNPNTASSPHCTKTCSWHRDLGLTPHRSCLDQVQSPRSGGKGPHVNHIHTQPHS